MDTVAMTEAIMATVRLFRS